MKTRVTELMRDVLETGNHRFRYIATPQLSHGWDACG
jgi:hypothetical protein